ncbi:Uncharacterised protein [Klebsiella pneumoniae]|nr:Uncharacterised protein [Klebsiella pneumoniae]
MSKESHKEENKPHPAKDNPSEHGEIPRTRDGSQDDKKDPYKDPAKK